MKSHIADLQRPRPRRRHGLPPARHRSSARRRAARISVASPEEALMGFLAPWFLAGAARGGFAHLSPPAAPPYDHAASLQLADVLRAAYPKLHQASPPALSAPARFPPRRDPAHRAGLRQSLYRAFRRCHGGREARSAGHRRLFQHARRYPLGRCQARCSCFYRCAQTRRSRASHDLGLPGARPHRAHAGSGRASRRRR